MENEANNSFEGMRGHYNPTYRKKIKLFNRNGYEAFSLNIDITRCQNEYLVKAKYTRGQCTALIN